MDALESADDAEADPSGDQRQRRGTPSETTPNRDAEQDQSDIAPLAEFKHESEGMLRVMPRRGPTELLILFQLTVLSAFAGVLVWMLLSWAGAL